MKRVLLQGTCSSSLQQYTLSNHSPATALCATQLLKPPPLQCFLCRFNQYEYFYGSFVAMPDVYGTLAKYDLTITAPSGNKLYEVHTESEATFHLVPVESGSHRFCLKFNPDASPTRAVIYRDVLWNINVGYSEGHDKVEETDTQYLWHHVYQIDGQVQELKATLNYLYWRERRHRQTVESTHKRTMFYAFLRCAVLVGASVGQVLYIRHMFTKRYH
jgi:hypothetical protein